MAAKPDPEAEYGGYDYQYALEVPERFICNICTKVQRDPHLTSCCGQHFCESCLEHWFKKQGKKSCPHCRKGLHHFLNKERKRDIHELKIHCIHHGEGCQWVGELGNIQTHLDKLCSCVEVECTNKCRVSLRLSLRLFGFTTCRKLKRKDLPHHLSNECYLRDYKCEHCGHVDTYEKIAGFTVIHMQRRKSHYDECPEYPLDCPNMCGTVAIKRKYMYAHQETVCPLETIACQDKPKPKSQGGQDPLLLSTETTTTAINVCSRCIPPTSDCLKRSPSYKYTRVVVNIETFIGHETLTVRDNLIVLSVVLMRHHCPFCTSSLR